MRGIRTFLQRNERQGGDIVRTRRRNRAESLLLDRASGIKLESEEEFSELVDLDYYRQFFCDDCFGQTYPTSLDNMMRQWHSIESVWRIMSEYERERKVDPYDGRNCSVAGGARGTHCFDRVGLFRLDLSYQDPIRVLGGGEGGDDDDEEGSPPAVVPSIMHVTSIHPLQLNDRLFYGDRKFAEIWATVSVRVDRYLCGLDPNLRDNTDNGIAFRDLRLLPPDGEVGGSHN